VSPTGLGKQARRLGQDAPIIVSKRIIDHPCPVSQALSRKDSSNEYGNALTPCAQTRPIGLRQVLPALAYGQVGLPEACEVFLLLRGRLSRMGAHGLRPVRLHPCNRFRFLLHSVHSRSTYCPSNSDIRSAGFLQCGEKNRASRCRFLCPRDSAPPA